MNPTPITRTFKAPAQRVYDAWTRPELFKQWWTPASFGMSFLSCEIDARTGGGYRFVFSHPSAKEPMAFFGKYLEVVPNSRLVWTNEEGEDGAVTTVTFEEKAGKTRVVLSELFPSKEALEANGGGITPEQFDQLDELLVSLGVATSTP